MNLACRSQNPDASWESLAAERLGRATEAGGVGFFEWDLSERRIVMSRYSEALWGFTTGEFSGEFQDLQDRLHPDDMGRVSAALDRCVEDQERFSLEITVLAPGLPPRKLDWRGDLAFDSLGRTLRMRGVCLETRPSSSTPDLEAATRTLPQIDPRESEAQRLARLYQALSCINQAIAWTPAKQDLLEKVCRALVEQGGFGMAWIGRRVPETGALVPLAVVGDADDYASDINVDVAPDDQGPYGRAFREGRPYIRNDILNEPTPPARRTKLERHGFRSAACFPVREMGQTTSVLSVYAQQVGAFGEQDITLLQNAADDLSLALEKLTEDEGRLQIERQLLRERKFSDAVLESLPGVVCLLDQNRKLLHWNKNLERVSGCPPREIAEMKLLDFFPADSKTWVDAEIESVFRGGRSQFEATLSSRDGACPLYHFSGIRTKLDSFDCMVAVGIDISDRDVAEKAKSSSEALYRKLFEYAPVGILISGPERAYIDANPCACEMLGYDIKELTGLRAADIVDSRETDRRGECWIRRKDGSVFPAEVKASLMPDGNLLGIMRDITERKESESTLRVLNFSLEEKVAARTEELRAALFRAEAADRVKSAFLATMSHELRTPLNSIIGFTGIILQGLAGPLTSEQTKQLGMVRASSRHLLELISDIMDLSKIEADELEVRSAPFDLKVSIERILASVKPQVESRGLKLQAELSPTIGILVSDRRRVEQILLNLVGNAIKFTSNGCIVVTAEPIADRVRVRVRDTGIGVKPEDLLTLFRPFRQIDSALDRQREGTGLGLAISRRLATLLGGDLTATSEWRQGSEFTLVLPTRAEPQG